MATEEVLNKSEFLNWIKTVVGLYHVKQGVLGFVKTYINAFHTQTVQRVGCNSCSDCSKEAVCEQCEKKLQKLFWQNHRFKKQKYTNLSLTKSIQNPWELAICFVNEAQPEMVSPEKTDCSAVISIIVNCKFLETKLNNVAIDGKTDIFSKTRVVRNRLFHSGEFKLSKDNLIEYLERMKDLLLCSKEFDQSLITELEELEKEEFVITKVPAKLIIDELVGGITGKVEEVKNQMQDGFKAIADNLKDHAEKTKKTSDDLNLVDFFNEIHDKTKEYFERKKDDAVHNAETMHILEEENTLLTAKVSELEKYKNDAENLKQETVQRLEEEKARLTAEVLELKKEKNDAETLKQETVRNLKEEKARLAAEVLELKKDKNDAETLKQEALQKMEDDNERLSAKVSELTKHVDTLGLQTVMASSTKSIQNNLMSASVRLLKKVTIGDLNLDYVYIYAAKFLNDGRLLASDAYNKRLLMFNSDFGFIEQFPVDGSPWGLCISTDSTSTSVHVVCDENKVVTYTLQGGLQETSQFEIGEDVCRGLDRSGDTFICGTRRDVVMYNKDGQKLSSIQLQINGFDPAICTSTNGDMFYHTDGSQLVGRTLQDRKEIFRYSNPSLKVSEALSCDRDGNILVPGCHAFNIHQVSSDGQKGRILIDKLSSIIGPCCVCCHPNRDLFVVASDSEDTVMEIYEFC